VHPVYRVRRLSGGDGSPVHRRPGGGAGGTLTGVVCAVSSKHGCSPRGLLEEKGSRGTSPLLAVGGTGTERGFDELQQWRLKSSDV
jgi:hypothetical protein